MTRTGADYADEITRRVGQLVAWARSVAAERLYEQPPDGEWTPMENLVHVVEFLPYWAAQVRSVVANPGQPFGRTHDDRDRARWIDEHRVDQVDEVLQALTRVGAAAAQTVATVPHDAWQATGVHANRGEMTLAEIVEFFITNHLRDHAEQAHLALAATA